MEKKLLHVFPIGDNAVWIGFFLFGCGEEVAEIEGNIGAVEAAGFEIGRGITVAVIVYLCDHDVFKRSMEAGAKVEKSIFGRTVFHPEIAEDRRADPREFKRAKIVCGFNGLDVARKEIGRHAECDITENPFAKTYIDQAFEGEFIADLTEGGLVSETGLLIGDFHIENAARVVNARLDIPKVGQAHAHNATETDSTCVFVNGTKIFAVVLKHHGVDMQNTEVLQ